ncbi:hypothetical protein JTE90_016569 [Oedothorax gibbosus]|uniref:Transposase n=1 Tax=Oedothorax gibbosus TaxID=931172 RepID=A0AAV6UAD1_9ARAC|nr:hypothetical protein JTE90_016569 [Oedothorax gibbosus]
MTDVFKEVEIDFVMTNNSEIINMDVSETSNVSNTNHSKDMSKRKVVQDIKSHIQKKKRFQKGPKSYEVREILKADPFKFCQDLGLIAKSVTCYCNAEMKWTNKTDKNCKDPFVWRCRKNKHCSKMTIRKNTFFEKSNTELTEILWIIYMWVYDYSMASMLHETDISHQTVLQLSYACDRVCQDILEFKTGSVGGEQKSVEIFECSLKEELSDGSESWVFGALELGSTKSLLVIMPDKSPETILKMLDREVISGSTLVSYNWSAFKNLTADNFHYLKKDRLLNLFNMWTKSDIETFRDFQFAVNQPMAGTYFWHKAVYEESFFKKVYRRSLFNAPDAFTTFLKDIAMVHKPCDKIPKPADKTTDQTNVFKKIKCESS